MFVLNVIIIDICRLANLSVINIDMDIIDMRIVRIMRIGQIA